MNSEVKIPTVLGLGILTAGLVTGVVLVTSQQILKSQANQPLTPKNITVANLSDTSASIFWQTDTPTTGFIQAGSTASLGLTFSDERDQTSPQNRQLHFVTLTKLTPDTTYYYRIVAETLSYPRDPLNFKTTSSSIFSPQPPIIGTVLDTSSRPVKEAIVTLELTGIQTLAAITKLAGNFILPLATSQVTERINSESTPSATLVVFDTLKRSRVIIRLPEAGQTLPPIILGQNSDFSSPPSPDKQASPSATPTRYDLNSDGVVNSLDLAIIFQNWGEKPKDQRANLNGDGVVDQKDVDILIQYLFQTSLK